MVATTAGSAAGGGLAERAVAADRGERCGRRGSCEAMRFKGGEARLRPAQLGLRSRVGEAPEASTWG